MTVIEMEVFMEYYILKLYQREKEKNVNVEQGFNRFAPKTKRVIIGCCIWGWALDIFLQIF